MRISMRTVGLLCCLTDLLVTLTLGVYVLVHVSVKAKATAHASLSSAIVRHTVSPTVAASPLDSIANPVRLIIPAIGINAAIESLGVLPNGNLATPVQSPWEDAGWYDLGPRPGETAA